MTAPAASVNAPDLRPAGRRAPRKPGAPQAWRLIEQFSTLESAQEAAERLRLRGVITSVSMVGGLSVIARS